jgi:hypothetical protein
LLLTFGNFYDTFKTVAFAECVRLLCCACFSQPLSHIPHGNLC